MSSVNISSSDLQQNQEQFVFLVEHRDVPRVRDLLQSMSSDEDRSRLYQATRGEFKGPFTPLDDSWVRCTACWRSCCDLRVVILLNQVTSQPHVSQTAASAFILMN